MAQDRNPTLEPIQKSAQAAHMLRGAVKTGKAIAGAAKGAAAGGPAGAAIGFAVGNRKVIGKIIIAATALLMLPVMILCMLPSLIFGSLFDSHNPNDPDTPVLNSNTVITENTNEICRRVDTILAEALANTLNQIQQNYSASGAAQMDIINPYASQISFDACRLVSMYCASKEGDPSSISLDDLEQMIRRNVNRLFSYSFTEEARPVMVTDPETGELVQATTTDPNTGAVTPVTELWRIYTVSYNGDTYFSTQVFSLTAEQQALANDYASNLNLFLQDSTIIPNVNTSFQKNTAINISGYRDPYTKNNLDLVTWAIEAEKNHWGYVRGTYGCILDTALYEYKLKQYPDGVQPYASFITANWLGGRTADCIGLIKGYSWLDVETLKVGYGTNGMPDISADPMYYNATEKGPISTMPDIPGLAVWTPGHIGIYIGNGEVIEAMGTKYGVVRTKVAERNWTHWLKIPYITYY